MASVQEDAKENLEKVQSFDVQSLVRRESLGDAFAFGEVTEPAEKLVELFRRIPTDQLKNYPDQQSDELSKHAANQLARFQKILDFDPTVENSAQVRQSLINEARSSFQGVFNQLQPHITYLGLQQQDFASIGNEARAALGEVKASAQALEAELRERLESSQVLLKEMRDIAAEQGVGNQAIHFSNQADHHRDQAKDWLSYTIMAALITAAYSIGSLFFHLIPGIDTSAPYQAFQLAVSKVLIFGVSAYLTVLCAKNYLSHRHNEVVNRHRQNALATFKALAEATSDAASSDIVLSHAAACIFAPQETGLTKQEGASSDGVPSLQFLPRIGGNTSGV